VLLLVHGFLSSSAQWLANLGAIGRVCVPVTVDLWGHGGSPSPTDPDAYSSRGYLAELDAIREALDAERLFLCGYSLGAGLTIGYALRWPERVSGHVFTNSSSGLADDAQLAAWQRAAPTAAERILAGGHAAIEAIPVHPRHATRIPTPVFDALMRDAARLDPVGVANTLLYTNPTVSVRSRLHENRAPALLACGRHESRFRDKRDLAIRTMPRLDVVDLDAGHAVNMEDAPGFNRAVTEFVERWSG
jgi:2-succinyl-6-hydroxy-2,4-cyclohexadiene-1-carboxylate synthase